MEQFYTSKSEGGFDSDLALERRRADVTIPGVEYKKEKAPFGIWERIKITSDEGVKSIGRPKGQYDTLTIPRMDLLDASNLDDATEEVARELCYMCDKNGIFPERILVVGLGNKSLTPDAVGPESASRVEATMQLRQHGEEMFLGLECSEIAVLIPGVESQSGIETAEHVYGVSSRVRPDLILAIDSLTSRSPNRLGTTIQISDTGIRPSSGLGKGSMAIDEDTLGIPVISIGVPTVIDSRMFVIDGDEISSPDCSSGMFVSPKEINGIVKSAAKIISGGINQAFGIF